jgi:hypothetical protein
MTNEQAEYCYECTGYGDDYYTDENGELTCYCPQCPFNPLNEEDEDDE